MNSVLRIMQTYRIGPLKAWKVKRLLDAVDEYHQEQRDLRVRMHLLTEEVRRQDALIR